MKTRQRSFPLDQVSVEDKNRHIFIFTHGQKIRFQTNNQAGYWTDHEFTFNQLFEMISKLRQEKEV